MDIRNTSRNLMVAAMYRELFRLQANTDTPEAVTDAAKYEIAKLEERWGFNS